jgi:hypothetical protein
VGKKLEGIPTKDLYALKSSMNDIQRRGGNASKYFWWAIKPKDEKPVLPTTATPTPSALPASMVIFDESSGMYQRATWDTLHDDITEQADACVAFIAHVIESHRPPIVPQPASPEAIAALGAA